VEGNEVGLVLPAETPSEAPKLAPEPSAVPVDGAGESMPLGDVSTEAPLPVDAESAPATTPLLTDAEPVEGLDLGSSGSIKSLRFSFYSGVNIRATDNLFIQPRDKQGDVSLVLGAGVAIARAALCRRPCRRISE
jgi:hypothetical protein